MKRLTFLLHAGLILIPALALPVQAADALWNKTMEQTKLAKQFAAKDIDMSMTAAKGSDPMRTIRFKSQLSEWVKNQPVYTTTQVDPVPDASKPTKQNASKLMKIIMDMEESLLEPNATATRTDGQKLDGKTWSVFQLEDSGVGQKVLSKIWVDAETGCIHQIDTNAHVTLQFDVHLKTSYEQDAQGRCLPNQIDADIEIIIPFMGKKMKLKQISTNWVARPV